MFLAWSAVPQLGLDHNETRSWHGWHRHFSLVMLAFAMIAVIRYRANDATPQKRPADADHQAVGTGDIAKRGLTSLSLATAKL